MKIRKYIGKLGATFHNAHTSLFLDENGRSCTLEVSEQKRRWKEKYKATIGGNYFSNQSTIGRIDPIWIEFENESDYLMFMLTWS
jgi:hypothetical protein